ncbi:AMP-binding protein [Xenorhabdus littoralis]|uniref:AMP-binding protein n=1 Tax=Xenorhabdus littoralis TaxID=2582835 RepID=UPI0029E80B54|nr:AMP-binding protein [Xenorhabdus sp. psl]MDX7993230.1 acyl--CoA ligase [Xenorhabdus sp. psl]
MLTIVSLLQNNWRVKVKNQSYNGADFTAMTQSAITQILTHSANYKTNRKMLFVFLIRNNLEGMLYYFIASALKLKAMIVNIRDITTIQMLIEEDNIAAYVMSPVCQARVPINKKIVLTSHSISTNYIRPTYDFTPFPYAYFYFMTSGTTGKPKLIQYKEIRLTGNADQVRRYLKITSDDNTLCIFPIQYMYGLSTMLSTLISEGGLIFEHYQLNSISEIINFYSINTLPLIGDLMLPLSKILAESRTRLTTILNASDSLLTFQATQIMNSCDVLWNNFGQTESGPRLFCHKFETTNDIEKKSRNGVVAPGFVISDGIKIQLKEIDSITSFKQMYYQTPYSSDGYINRQLILLPNDRWFNSGDLFEKDNDECYYWISRTVNEFKINGKFFPEKEISNQIIQKFGYVSHYFSKTSKGLIEINIESTVEKEIINNIKVLLSNSWCHYDFVVNVIPIIPKTSTGKIISRSVI